MKKHSDKGIIEWERKCHEILGNCEKQLLDKASVLKQHKLDCLGAQRKGVALATNDIQGLVEFIECSVTNATDEEIMVLQEKINKYENVVKGMTVSISYQ